MVPSSHLQGVVSCERVLGRGRGRLTSGNLSTGSSKQVYGLLDVVDTVGEVGAALQKLHVLAQVVHGGEIGQPLKARSA